MKSEPTIEFDSEVDEFDDFQYEVTTSMAHTFVEETVLPLVEEFDYNNPCEDYIPGVASFGLFIKLVGNLLQDGFTQEQLKEIVDEYSVTEVDGTIH